MRVVKSSVSAVAYMYNYSDSCDLQFELADYQNSYMSVCLSFRRAVTRRWNMYCQAAEVDWSVSLSFRHTVT